MLSFDWNLKRCRTCVDRLTTLPYDLLSQILSNLPTKDAAATQVLSKKMKRAFCRITSVDLDISPVTHCIKHPHLVERSPLFQSFIDNVLAKLSQSQQGRNLTRFRLRLGGEDSPNPLYYDEHKCDQACFPSPEPTRLHAWISYPLAHCSLKELDLSFRVRNPAECELPPGLLAHQSLQVLRLDSNIEINGSDEMPVICLPNLKLLHLRSFVFNEDDFVTRLVSNCPALEDLSITDCWWENADRLIISSHSLRRLDLTILKYEEEKNSDLVLIDTPNLQYLKYVDNLTCNYSIAPLNALVEAYIYIDYPLQFHSLETSFRVQLSLIKALSGVQDLSLHGCSVETLHLASVSEEQLPVFRNLKTLKLAAICNSVCGGRWDIVLLLILHSSPLLEALIFPEGFFCHGHSLCATDRGDPKDVLALEADGWRTTQTIPSCFQSHLKRIMINRCCGCDRELNMIRYLLGNASVLKEFVLCLPKVPYGVQFDGPSFDQFKNTLEDLPRLSSSCSITYCNDESIFI